MLPRHVVRTLRQYAWVESQSDHAGETGQRRLPALTVAVLSASKAARHRPTAGTAIISIRGPRDPEVALSTQYRAAAICDVLGLPYRWTVYNDDVYLRVREAMLALPRDAGTTDPVM